MDANVADGNTETATTSNIFVDNCDRYWDAGLPVMPLRRYSPSGGRDGKPSGKEPVVLGWQKLQSEMPSEAERASWRLFHGDGNIALPLGPQSGLIAIDVDTDDPQLVDAILSVLPPSPWKRVGKKGMALIYRYDGQSIVRIRYKDSEGRIGSLVEVLGAGSQIVLPPSIHPDTGRPYIASCSLAELVRDQGGRDRIPSLPTDIERRLRDALSAAGVQVLGSGAGSYGSAVDYVSVGNRDNTLVSFAGLFARAVIRGERTLLEACGEIELKASAFMQQTYGDSIDPAKGVQKLITFLINDVTGPRGGTLPRGWDDGVTSEQRADWGLDALSAFTSFKRTGRYTGNDQGLATRFIDENCDDLKYVADEGVWLIWNGNIWERDDKGQVVRMYLSMASAMLVEAENIEQAATGDEKKDSSSNKTREKCISWAKQAGESKRVSSTLKIAQTDPRIVVTLAQLDNLPGFLPVANGIVELASGMLLLDTKERLATRATPYPFDPTATCPRWEAVIARALPGELGPFFQRVLGYALMGNPCEQRFFVLRGEGSDSKSTISRVMSALLGSLLIRPAGETFLASDAEITGSAPRADLMPFMHARVAFTPEPDSRRKLDKELIKRIAGQDGLSARPPYGRKVIEFETPTVVLMLANHLPGCDEADAAAWRRLVLIPFDHSVPEAERDTILVERLLRDEAEGILAWLIEGARIYNRDGLQVPEVVRQRTADWRRTVGRIERFADEDCIRDGSALLKDLHQAYRWSCQREQIHPLGLDKFSARLKQLGFTISVAQAGETVIGLRSRW